MRNHKTHRAAAAWGRHRALLAAVGMVANCLLGISARADQPLPGTEPYVAQGDLAEQTLDGIARFLLERTEQSVDGRAAQWNRNFDSPDAYQASVQPNRDRFRHILGAVDVRQPVTALELVATTALPAKVAETDSLTVWAVRWPVVGPITGEGLLLEPKSPIRASVVALPDADQSPEQLVGLLPGVAAEAQFARRLAENGCRVLVPTLIDRQDEFSGNDLVGRFTNQPHREWIHRQAFQMGRHVIGYEVQKVQAAVDWFLHEGGQDQAAERPRVGVAGYGEGGLIALYAAALDPRIDAALVSGYFEPREGLWQEPIYRNVWGLLTEFGDAEIASLVAPRALVIEYSRPPVIDGPPPARPGRSGAAPGRIAVPDFEHVRAEFLRARALLGDTTADSIHLVHGPDGALVEPGSEPALSRLLASLDGPAPLKPIGNAPEAPAERFDVVARQRRQVRQMEDHTQRLMEWSAFARADFFWTPTRQRAGKPVDPSYPERWDEAVQPMRDYFQDQVIGRLPEPSMPIRARTKKIRDEERWTGYLVVLDVWPEVISWGYLLVPKDLDRTAGQRRPVVVCQHGLGGLPETTIDPASQAYRAYAARLAERGFLVYSPYNPNAVRGGDRFRVLQRMANPTKCSIFSVIIGQHQRILQWLAQQPIVDPDRIGLYGLSYGGKTAMRVPAVVDGYALSICSGDFNEWIRKIVTPYATTAVAAGSQRFSSYMFTAEYEIMEFNLGNTFNYAEMAAMIAPRPFMVERGHRDLVASDEWAAFEYATVRRHYTDLGIPERTEIEFFDDGHVIHGEGTFRFLHGHLNWPD
jgi:dienelactone hydrolase